MAAKFWLGALVVLAVAVCCSIAASWYCRRRGWACRLAEGTDDIEGVYVTVLATVYAVVLAFMVFVVWTQYWEALQVVQSEAVALGQVHRLADWMEAEKGAEIARGCERYATLVADEEWPAMADAGASSSVDLLIDEMYEDVLAVQTDRGDPIKVREQLLESFLELDGLRGDRLLRARERLPAVLWALLVVGACVTITFAVLFGGERFATHALKAAALTTLITAALTAIVALDHPFRGFTSISPAPIQAIGGLE